MHISFAGVENGETSVSADVFFVVFDLETGFMKLSYKKIKKYFFMDKVRPISCRYRTLFYSN